MGADVTQYTERAPSSLTSWPLFPLSPTLRHVSVQLFVPPATQFQLAGKTRRFPAHNYGARKNWTNNKFNS